MAKRYDTEEERQIAHREARKRHNRLYYQKNIERLQQREKERQMNLYQNDPHFREQKKQYSRDRYHVLKNEGVTIDELPSDLPDTVQIS